LSDPFVEVLVDYEKKWKAETFPETSVQDQTINPGVQGAKVEKIHLRQIFCFFKKKCYFFNLYSKCGRIIKTQQEMSSNKSVTFSL
jgi:hypothetical protein